MAKIRLIANPHAGRGRGRNTLPQVVSILGQAGVEFSLAETEYPGHAIELARRAVADGYPTVVALGGDGTVNEVLNGLCADLGDDPNPGEVVTLGIVPAGSGNDFAYAVGLPTDVPGVCHRLVNGRTRVVDMGRINDRYFAYGVGLGLDAEVNIESRKIAWLRGMSLYLLAILKVVLWHRRVYQVEISVDDARFEQQAIMISVANGQRYAGSFLVAPDAQVDDGLFDVCIVSPVSRLNMFRFLPLILKGRHTKLHPVRMTRGKKVVVKSTTPLVTHVDGEIFGLNERCYEFSLLHRRLRVIY